MAETDFSKCMSAFSALLEDGAQHPTCCTALQPWTLVLHPSIYHLLACVYYILRHLYRKIRTCMLMRVQAQHQIDALVGLELYQ